MNSIQSMSKNGFSQIVVMIAAMLLLVGIVITIFFVMNRSEQKTESRIIPIETDLSKCDKQDYGGCDNEQNFYQWKDDGLP